MNKSGILDYIKKGWHIERDDIGWKLVNGSRFKIVYANSAKAALKKLNQYPKITFVD